MPAGDTVEWVPEDESRWWLVLFKNGRTPFPNKRRTFKGRGRHGPRMKTRRGIRRGTEYDYWLIYEGDDGTPQVSDPKIVIEDE